MKRIILAFSLGFASLTANSQVVNYQVLEEDPKVFSRTMLGVDVMLAGSMDLPGIHVGPNAIKFFSDRLGAEGYAHIGSTGLRFNGGAFFALSENVKSKDMKIVLSEKSNINGQVIQESVIVPSTRYSQLFARGGLFFPYIGKNNMGGIYGGIGTMNNRGIIAKLNNGDPNVFGYMQRWYFDAMLLPIREVYDRYDGTRFEEGGVFGWRVGYQFWWSATNETYKSVNNRNFFSRFSFSAEIGSLPEFSKKSYASIGLTYMIIRK